MIINLTVGTLCCGYGIFVIIMRILKKESFFRKLPAIKAKFGDSQGAFIHLLAYGIFPILAGLTILAQGT